MHGIFPFAGQKWEVRMPLFNMHIPLWDEYLPNILMSNNNSDALPSEMLLTYSNYCMPWGSQKKHTGIMFAQE